MVDLICYLFLYTYMAIWSNCPVQINQVLETAQQVASLPASTLITYDQVKDQCEALVSGKQQKMSVLQSFKQQLEAKAIVLANDTDKKKPAIMDVVRLSYYYV